MSPSLTVQTPSDLLCRITSSHFPASLPLPHLKSSSPKIAAHPPLHPYPEKKAKKQTISLLPLYISMSLPRLPHVFFFHFLSFFYYECAIHPFLPPPPPPHTLATNRPSFPTHINRYTTLTFFPSHPPSSRYFCGKGGGGGGGGVAGLYLNTFKPSRKKPPRHVSSLSALSSSAHSTSPPTGDGGWG